MEGMDMRMWNHIPLNETECRDFRFRKWKDLHFETAEIEPKSLPFDRLYLTGVTRKTGKFWGSFGTKNICTQKKHRSTSLLRPIS